MMAKVLGYEPFKDVRSNEIDKYHNRQNLTKRLPMLVPLTPDI